MAAWGVEVEQSIDFGRWATIWLKTVKAANLKLRNSNPDRNKTNFLTLGCDNFSLHFQKDQRSGKVKKE